MQDEIEEYLEEHDEFIVYNFILKNGTNIIGEVLYADDHSLSIHRPIEILKRSSQSNNGTYEVITTSPYLVMTETYNAQFSMSDILVKNFLHRKLYEMYLKMADKYYIDLSDTVQNLNETDIGTIH